MKAFSPEKPRLLVTTSKSFCTVNSRPACSRESAAARRAWRRSAVHLAQAPDLRVAEREVLGHDLVHFGHDSCSASRSVAPNSVVPLNIMCSSTWAVPVIPGTSSTDPTST